MSRLMKNYFQPENFPFAIIWCAFDIMHRFNMHSKYSTRYHRSHGCIPLALSMFLIWKKKTFLFSFIMNTKRWIQWKREFWLLDKSVDSILFYLYIVWLYKQWLKTGWTKCAECFHSFLTLFTLKSVICIHMYKKSFIYCLKNNWICIFSYTYRV